MASRGWQLRNARAQAAGYRNYYDYRAHDYGKIPAVEPAAGGFRLTRLRGHTSSADLADAIESGRVVMTQAVIAERNALGQATRVDVLATMQDGSQREYSLRGQALSKRSLGELVRATEAPGAGDTIFVFGSPPNNWRAQLVDEDEEPDEGDDDLEDEDEDGEE